LLDRAEPNRPEVEAALAAYFGCPVPLRLVLDDVSVAAQPAYRRAEEEWVAPSPPDVDEFRELKDAPAAVMSPEQRLLEAFPGAEEV
jgi:hypothetical protein